MRLISHRGNLNGPNSECENNPTYVDYAISQGYDVEIDLFVFDYFTYQEFWLGHDGPQYKIDLKWLEDRSCCLLVHCKNYDALAYFVNRITDIDYFWHENDRFALTSFNCIITYPGCQAGEGSIVMKPELNGYTIGQYCEGICSDYISKFSKQCAYSSPEQPDSSGETSEQS